MNLPNKYGFGFIPLSYSNRDQAMESEMVSVRDAGLFGVINNGNFISSEYVHRTSNTMNNFINSLISKNRSGKVYRIIPTDEPVSVITEFNNNILSSSIEASDDTTKFISYFSLYLDTNLVNKSDSTIVSVNDINVEIIYKIYKGANSAEKTTTISLDKLNNLNPIEIDYSDGTINGETSGDSKLEISSIKLSSETDTLDDKSILLYDILLNVKSDDVFLEE